MKIPKKIKLLSHDYKVKLINQEESDTEGDFDPYNQIIRINKDYGKESGQAETFLHELIEASVEFGELEIKHQDITTLSQFLFDTIRKNKLDFSDTSEMGYDEG